MYPDYLITIGGKGYVTLYGIMIAIGILCCFITLTVYVKKKNVDEKIADFVFYVAIIAIALGFLSATLARFRVRRHDLYRRTYRRRRSIPHHLFLHQKQYP